MFAGMWECVQQFKFILTVDWLAADKVRRQIEINYRSELNRCEWNRCEIELENDAKADQTRSYHVYRVNILQLQLHTTVRGCCVLADTESIE